MSLLTHEEDQLIKNRGVDKFFVKNQKFLIKLIDACAMVYSTLDRLSQNHSRKNNCAFTPPDPQDLVPFLFDGFDPMPNHHNKPRFPVYEKFALRIGVLGLSRDDEENMRYATIHWILDEKWGDILSRSVHF